LKRLGLLPNVKLLATTQSYLQDSEVRCLDKVIIFSRREIGLRAADVQHKYHFIPLPADGDFDNLSPLNEERPYIFTGGGAGRDFTSLIDAIRGLNVLLKIVTFSSQSLNYTGQLPDNCQVFWKMPRQEFLQIMAGAKFVVVPLKKGEYPHGHTTIVQALRMGKAVITNENASADDYVVHGRNGLLIPAGDSSAYRQAIETIWHDDALCQSYEQQARAEADSLTHATYADRLTELCQELIG
jgi:glycosyltransferase involved in cell wall biosynthesis